MEDDLTAGNSICSENNDEHNEKYSSNSENTTTIFCPTINLACDEPYPNHDSYIVPPPPAESPWIRVETVPSVFWESDDQHPKNEPWIEDEDNRAKNDNMPTWIYSTFMYPTDENDDNHQFPTSVILQILEKRDNTNFTCLSLSRVFE